MRPPLKIFVVYYYTKNFTSFTCIIVNIFQPQTLVLLTMAVNMFASKEAITKQHVLALLITSWRAMENVVEVFNIFIFIYSSIIEILSLHSSIERVSTS